VDPAYDVPLPQPVHYYDDTFTNYTVDDDGWTFYESDGFSQATFTNSTPPGILGMLGTQTFGVANPPGTIGGYTGTLVISVASVPEPSTILMLALGLAGVLVAAAVRWRSRALCQTG
jgi:PEP-CTERM motif